MKLDRFLMIVWSAGGCKSTKMRENQCKKSMRILACEKMQTKKGGIINVAILAGIMGAKKTS